MTEIPEHLRREQIVAMSIAKSQGMDYGGVSSEDRRRLHVIARTCMPAVQFLIHEAEKMFFNDAVKESRLAASKGYIDGFADGLFGSYRNYYQDREKWGVEEARLKEMTLPKTPRKDTKWPLVG